MYNKSGEKSTVKTKEHQHLIERRQRNKSRMSAFKNAVKCLHGIISLEIPIFLPNTLKMTNSGYRSFISMTKNDLTQEQI